MDVIARRSAEVQFGLAWNWEYDQDFIRLIDHACLLAGIRCYLVGPHNLEETALEVQNNERRFLWFLDRASDNDERFLRFNQLLQTKGTRFLNAHHHYQRAIDKANIHGDLLLRGLHVPLTVILPPAETEPDLDPRILEPFPRPFVVKPSRGGGGVGVMLSATELVHVAQSRQQMRHLRFLVQQRIEPQILRGRRAWFRVYYVCGQVLPCWWDDQTHRYAIVTPADATVVNVGELERITRIVAEVSQLDFFSTEIALDRSDRYIVVDYVNDPCDMRLQSKHFDGPPDTIVQRIVHIIVDYLRQQFHPTAQTSPNDICYWP